jgi:pSer/pThr/pTyr-binding forkhead associated (FHA) protein
MATPMDDDGLGTIGLPRRAVQEILKGPDPSKRKAPDRSPIDARGLDTDDAGPSPTPARRSASLEGGSSRRETPRGSQAGASQPFEDLDTDCMATVPPAGRRPAEREAPAPSGLKPGENQRARAPIGRVDVPSSPASRGRASSEPPRRDVPPSPAVGRPMDESDFSTNPLPVSRPRPAGPPAQSPPARPLPDESGSFAFPDETGVIPPGLAVPAPVPSSAEHYPSNPGRSLGSDDQFRAQAPSPPRPAPPVPPRRPVPAEDGIDRTIGWAVVQSQVSGTRSILQFYHNTIGRWSDLGEVGRQGKVLGRDTFQSWDANPEGLAEEHLWIGFEGDELHVEPLESLNGVYRRLQPNRPVELPPRTRFRIGRHVLELRLPDAAGEIVPERGSDGEVFQSRVLVPLGFIDLIGPNRRPYLSFPVTKREERGTRIGRAGVECDIALGGDEWVSLRHARIGFKDGSCWLEDLESTNGTYLIMSGRSPLRPGTAQHPATGDELLVGGYKIRVIEERV